MRLAPALRLVQTANHRSSHSRPTPTGGGISIVLASTVIGALAVSSFGLPALALTVLGMLVGSVGLIDDILELSSVARLAVQAGALALLLCVQPLDVLGAPFGITTPIFLAALLFAAGLWWINLVNFMDGIDGLAATQLILILLAVSGLVVFSVPAAADDAVLWWILALATATMGFLIFNWPPARMFMGDVGSTYLAFVTFGLALICSCKGWIALPIWLILSALLIVDATVTLLTRIRAGEKWYAGHRQHAYQHLSRRLGGHRPVTVLYCAISLFWLYPMAAMAHFQSTFLWPLVILTYLPLAILAVMLKAGRPFNG